MISLSSSFSGSNFAEISKCEEMFSNQRLLIFPTVNNYFICLLTHFTVFKFHSKLSIGAEQN